MKKRKLSKNQTVIIAVIIVLAVLGVVYFIFRSTRHDIKFGPANVGSCGEELDVDGEPKFPNTGEFKVNCEFGFIGKVKQYYRQFNGCKENLEFNDTGNIENKFSGVVGNCFCFFGDKEQSCNEKGFSNPAKNVKKCNIADVFSLSVDLKVNGVDENDCINNGRKACMNACKNLGDNINDEILLSSRVEELKKLGDNAISNPIVCCPSLPVSCTFKYKRASTEEKDSCIDGKVCRNFKAEGDRPSCTREPDPEGFITCYGHCE